MNKSNKDTFLKKCQHDIDVIGNMVKKNLNKWDIK